MTFGIPDPGRASSAVAMVVAATSPFDAIRNITLEGREYWSARDLMPLLGYEKWERFADAISRAKIAAHNSGHDVALNFPGAGKVSASGPSAQDYHLSRYACYLTALNGDPRKPEIAAAQTYFVIKAREAEVAAPVLTEDEIVHQALAITARRVEALSARVAELEPPAAAWNELAEAAGDYSVADAAKVLSRDPAIRTGQNRLFKVMRQHGWIYREDNHWRAYQAQVDAGRLVEKLGHRYWHADREEWVVPAPTIRVTTKGLADLQRHLGGGQQQLALAVAE